MTWSVDGERRRIAHRAVLDHLLGLVVGSPLGDALVLRGSMVMPAWVGADAREPADLDWIVSRPLLVPVDPEHPYPYVEEVEVVQQWPEAADGADRYEIWKFEEFDTPGIRLIVPWEAEGLPPGEVRLDFARDEWLPEPPVLTAIPRADGAGPTVVRTAGRELSLAWKLLWLHVDCATEGRAQAKDLYDAVLLAEAEATKLSPRLLRKVFRHEPGNTAAAGALRLDAVALWSVDWEDFRAEPPTGTGYGRGVASAPEPGAGTGVEAVGTMEPLLAVSG